MKVKINNIRLAGTAVAFMLAATSPKVQLRAEEPDTFVRTTAVGIKGTTDAQILQSAPNPNISINGENKTAKIVVELSSNTLYKYDCNGKAECAYKIASGKPSTPTDKGVRIVTHTETYPYRTAPRHTKRRRNPKAYGPKIICLNKIDPKTGEQSSTGEFIHGNNDVSSLGKYASKGCMRMDNEVIKALAKEVRRGDIVIIK